MEDQSFSPTPEKAPTAAPKKKAAKPQEKAPAPAERQFVIRTKRSDKFSVVRKRILLTPSVCPRCGTDICEINQLPPYDELSDEQALRVDGALKRHVKRHTPAEKQLLTESELAAAKRVLKEE